jgi:regulator of protease activity HflC (stomatin/prohibitin superfamily)
MRNKAFAAFQWQDPSRPSPVTRGRRFVLQEWERGVLFKDGRVDRVLDAGAHRRFGRGFALRRVDTRPWIVHVPTQEIPTADGLTVKVTVVGRARVVDAVVFVTAAQDVHASLYLNAQIATREVMAATTVDQLVASRQDLGDALTAAVCGVDEFGLTLERSS